MAPNSSTVVEQPNIESKVEDKTEFKTKIVWFNVLLFVYLHGSFLYGLYLAFTAASMKTVIFCKYCNTSVWYPKNNYLVTNLS